MLGNVYFGLSSVFILHGYKRKKRDATRIFGGFWKFLK